MRKLLFTVLAVLLMAACAKDETLVWNEQDMVFISGTTMTTDNGLVFKVVEDVSRAGWTEWKRAYIVCDVLRKISGAEYEIRLTEARQVLLKEAVADGELADEDLGDDPIDIVHGWVAGGCLNLMTYIAFDPKSDQPHFINLVSLGEKDGVLRFRLHHNSYGCYLGAPDVEPGSLTLGSSLVSFPVDRFLPAGVDAADAEINWKWHIPSEGGPLLPETEEKSARIVLRRGE